MDHWPNRKVKKASTSALFEDMQWRFSGSKKTFRRYWTHGLCGLVRVIWQGIKPI